MIYASGDIYRGEWWKDKRHYQGKMKYKDGTKEEG